LTKKAKKAWGASPFQDVTTVETITVRPQHFPHAVSTTTTISAAAALLTALIAAVLPARPARAQTGAFARTPPIVDGNVDAAWSRAEAYPIRRTIVGAPPLPRDLSGSFRVLWDRVALYLLVDVTDDVRMKDSSQIYDDDSVAVYLDVNNCKANRFGPDDIQNYFRWGEIRAVENKHNAHRNLAYAYKNTPGGYRIEIKLPWTTLRARAPKAGGSPQLLGIDVHINDDDDGGARDTKIAWFARKDNSYEMPRRFGTMTLAATDSELRQLAAAETEAAQASGENAATPGAQTAPLPQATTGGDARGSRLRVRVVEAATGAPITTSSFVTLTDAGGQRKERILVASDRGIATFENVPDGPATLSASPSPPDGTSPATKAITVAAAEAGSQPVEVSLTLGAPAGAAGANASAPATFPARQAADGTATPQQNGINPIALAIGAALALCGVAVGLLATRLLRPVPPPAPAALGPGSIGEDSRPTAIAAPPHAPALTPPATATTPPMQQEGGGTMQQAMIPRPAPSTEIGDPTLAFAAGTLVTSTPTPQTQPRSRRVPSTSAWPWAPASGTANGGSVAPPTGTGAQLATGSPRLVGLGDPVLGVVVPLGDGSVPTIGSEEAQAAATFTQTHAADGMPLAGDEEEQRQVQILARPDGRFVVSGDGLPDADTFVNGRRVQGEHLLEPGDEIQIGPARFRFEA